MPFGSTTSSFAFVSSRTRSLTTWYHRSSDIVIFLLNSIKSSFSLSPSSICTACALRKSNCHPHPPTQSRDTSLLQLVHFDIWGPSHVPYLFYYKYYVYFTDDIFNSLGSIPPHLEINFSTVLKPFLHLWRCNFTAGSK